MSININISSKTAKVDITDSETRLKPWPRAGEFIDPEKVS